MLFSRRSAWILGPLLQCVLNVWLLASTLLISARYQDSHLRSSVGNALRMRFHSTVLVFPACMRFEVPMPHGAMNQIQRRYRFSSCSKGDPRRHRRRDLTSSSYSLALCHKPTFSSFKSLPSNPSKRSSKSPSSLTIIPHFFTPFPTSSVTV